MALNGVHRADDGWWDRDTGWYRDRLPRGDRDPVTLWGSVHLFESLAAIEIASPTLGHVSALRDFAHGAERYWNPDLGGFGSLPGQRGNRRTWYDDNGWWGLAFLDAYRATHERRWLWDARRAYGFAHSGWDPVNGGIWWNTDHTFKAGESLATATLLAVELYGFTGAPYYLRDARELAAWGRTHTWNDVDGLYGRHETDRTSMPYVQAPMAAADVALCHLLRDGSLCDRGEAVADAAARRFPTLEMGPQYDAMYLRWLLYLYALDRNPRWYGIAVTEAALAQAHAGDGRGRWLRAWDGSSLVHEGADPSMLQPHAATTSVFAWLAATPPPPG
ncbi:MAG: glycoside hydrolase family 76 protein [Actinomycetota bacterium]|nr:glycoside hydrolase family 76 protein [Actinomycetota bacterium]